MTTRTIARVDVFPTRLPVVKTLGSAAGIGVAPELAALREFTAD